MKKPIQVCSVTRRTVTTIRKPPRSGGGTLVAYIRQRPGRFGGDLA